MIRYPVLFIAGVLSAVLMDLLSMVWMQTAPARLDLTANYFPMVVLPVALVLYFTVAVVLWKAFEPAPLIGSAVYLGTHLVAQALMLNYFYNPIGDIVVYEVILLAAGSVVLFVFNRYFWCPACAAI